MDSTKTLWEIPYIIYARAIVEAESLEHADEVFSRALTDERLQGISDVHTVLVNPRHIVPVDALRIVDEIGDRQHNLERWREIGIESAFDDEEEEIEDLLAAEQGPGHNPDSKGSDKSDSNV